jgi:hypothetical protein
MTDPDSGEPEPVWDGDAEPGPSNGPQSGLLALIIGPDDKPTCTIYPPDVARPYRTTTWISASGDSFVDLDDCR